MKRSEALAILAWVLAGCGASGGHGSSADALPVDLDGGSPTPDGAPPAPDAALVVPDAAIAMPDVGTATPDARLVAGPPAANTYCERTVDMFCDFYARCGRMAVADADACHAPFLETCNSRYEPIYAAFAVQGLLTLSTAGLDACAAHLATVACDTQIFDLDGPCAGLWIGGAPVGGACAPGIGSFVCVPDATCVLGLDFCGTCEAAVGPGTACDHTHRCHPDAACLRDVCVPRKGPGEACANESECVTAAACVDGICQTFARVGEGEACDASDRCPYRTACVGGTCRLGVANGAPCGAQDTCYAGFCDAGTCAALHPPGAACTQGFQCATGECAEGLCAALTNQSCFAEIP